MLRLLGVNLTLGRDLASFEIPSVLRQPLLAVTPIVIALRTDRKASCHAARLTVPLTSLPSSPFRPSTS